MPFLPWVSTVGNSPTPLPVSQGGTGSTTGVPAWLSGLLMPSGGLAETFPRVLAIASQAQTSGTTKCQPIGLLAGTVVTNIHTITSGTAEATPSNGWVALTDVNFNVLAVSAAQTGNTWGNANTDTPVALTSPYTVLTTACYYVCMSVSATTMPNFCSGSVPSTLGAWQVLPGSSLTRGTQVAPPSVSTVLGSSSTFTANSPLYAYVS